MDGDVKMSSLESLGQLHGLRGEVHVKHRLARITMKMAVFVHVRAITRRAAIQRDLPGETTFHERVEAIIDRGVGDFRHLPLGADENLLGGRMIALMQQHVIDLLALRRQAQAGGTQLFGQVLFVLLVAARLHCRKIYRKGNTSQDLE
jgi:hypothetical protein